MAKIWWPALTATLEFICFLSNICFTSLLVRWQPCTLPDCIQAVSTLPVCIQAVNLRFKQLLLFMTN
jgi:hypothetical protein